jgi:hypothetical protein
MVDRSGIKSGRPRLLGHLLDASRLVNRPPNGDNNGARSGTKTGWTAGGGFEYAWTTTGR